MQGLPPPTPGLAEAVRAGRWAEVRTLTASVGRPLPPLLALVAGRAARALGDPARALEVLRPALPQAGDLAAAVRLESAEATLALHQDPWPYVRPLLSPSSPVAHQQAAAACLRRAWEELPLDALGRVPRRALSPSLRRELASFVAVRGSDEAAALRVLADRVSDEATLRVARWLAARPGLALSTRLAVAEALLAGGAWREADQLLATIPSLPREALFKAEFLRGRAAYRLGELPRAAEAFDRALASASSDEDRFSTGVQRARVAEMSGDLPAALRFWDLARAARPREVEGWDGGFRVRAILGRQGEAIDSLKRCPAPVRRVAGPRLAATFLLRGDPDRARLVIRRLPRTLPVVRALNVALFAEVGELEAARAEAASLLADPRGGPWRDQVLALLPAGTPVTAPARPTRNISDLARIAVRSGPQQARDALGAALAADPAWAWMQAGAPGEPHAWAGAPRELAGVGLEREAAALYPFLFPGGSPEEEAWSARQLAVWGNSPAALSAGERLWARLVSVPAVLLPEKLLQAILPSELVARCVAAANEQAVPPPWLVGIIRQESRFDADAFSAAGAVGVAQFVPEAARRLGATPDDLRDRDLALRLAAREVARLSGVFGDRFAPVAAAYNAGEAVVASWLAEFGPRPEEALFIAAIPYRETAGYVLAVRQGADLARHLRGVAENR
jgi:soluble lytic murein transglycosylase-like protein